MSKAMKRPLFASLAAMLLAIPVIAQKAAVDELGFNAEKLYDFHDIDSVNLFNGNLTVTLPIGRRYQISSALSYQFALIYNGKVYDIETYEAEDADGNLYIAEDGVPARQSDAGLAWRVSLGRLLPPEDTTVNYSSFDRHHYIYEGPAGDEHEFVADDDDAAVILSNDPQPLRMLKIFGLTLPTRDVEFPNGEIHRFQQEGSVWRLKQMRDRFGNEVDIAYTYAMIDGKQRETKWTITDTIGRSHSISFIHHSALRETWSLGQSIDKIVLDGVGGADDAYAFAYTTCGLYPVLDHVDLPDPASLPYAFRYNPANSSCGLSKVTLPTGGSVSYTYQDYYFASEGSVCGNGPVGTDVLTEGIRTRTISDGVSTHTWEYVQRRGPKVSVDYASTPCHDAMGNPVGEYGPFYWVRTSVLAPVDAMNKRVRTDHYFNIFGEPVWPNMEDHAFPAANGLPFGYAGVAAGPPDSQARGPLGVIPEQTVDYPADVDASDGSSTDPRYLSSRSYEGCTAAGDCTNATLLRSTYVKHECDGLGLLQAQKGCWAVSTRTVYEDDEGCGTGGTPCYTQETFGGRTGGGFHTTTTTASNFPEPGTNCTATEPCGEAVTSVTVTAYPAWPSADRLDSTKPWITGTYTEQRRTEGTATAKTKYQFSANGTLEAVRVLAGADLGAADVLTIFDYDTSGNLVEEKSYGGDGAMLATNMCCATPESGLQYLTRRTYVDNFLTKVEYLDPTTCTDIDQTTCVSILTTRDVTVDPWSGLPTSARDSAGVETTYGYDTIGRLETIIPTGAASRNYAYTPATATANAQVTETLKAANGTVLGKSTFEFDGLGRVKRVSTPLPNDKLASMQTDYDEQGRKQRMSQPIERTTHPTTSIGSNWTTFKYDALGRQMSITAPDGLATVFGYVGARRMSRTSEVAASETGWSDAITTEHYDALGRLRRVEEDAGDTSATATRGTTVAISYTYDVGGRLTSVSDGTSTQSDRSFVYDGRGFLTEESHPESGETAYTGYDSRGHAATRTAGGKTLEFTYDFAERLTKVAQVVSETEKKPLKEFTFATANTGTSFQKGKLVTAIRHNDLLSAGKIEVKESYTYDTPSGRMSKRTTLVERVVGGTRSTLQKFEYGVDYDDFLLPRTLTMPTCSANGCSASPGFPNVTYERKAGGALTSVQNFASLTYHPTGMVETVEHASIPAATDTYSVSSGMARPSSISFSGGTFCPTITPSAIDSAERICPSASGNGASVTPRPGITHTWTISGGGTITSATTGDSITFTAPASGFVTLTVTATDTCNQSTSTSESVEVQALSAASPISAPGAVCGGSTGNATSVTPRAGITHTWSISGGTITSSAIGDAITFAAGASASVTLTVTATDNCGTQASNSSTVQVTPTPAAELSGSATIARGTSTRVYATLTGASPWRVEWSDGNVQSNVTSSLIWRDVAPNVTTTYSVSVSSGGCSGTNSNSVTLTVIPPPPAVVTATTQENREVLLTWSAVSGASGYRIERTTRRGGSASSVATVAGTVTAFADLVPASTAPVSYIYYVRTVDAYGALSERDAWDHATAATLLYQQPQLVTGSTVVKAADIGELRGAVDALRFAVYLPAAFGGSVAPSGLAKASDFTALVSALNEARATAGLSPFSYSGVSAPAAGGVVLGAHIQQFREALR